MIPQKQSREQPTQLAFDFIINKPDNKTKEAAYSNNPKHTDNKPEPVKPYVFFIPLDIR